MVGVSLGALAGLVIGAIEVYLVGFSLGLPLGSPLESPNPGAKFLSCFWEHLLGCCLDLKQSDVCFSASAS